MGGSLAAALLDYNTSLHTYIRIPIWLSLTIYCTVMYTCASVDILSHTQCTVFVWQKTGTFKHYSPVCGAAGRTPSAQQSVARTGSLIESTRLECFDCCCREARGGSVAETISDEVMWMWCDVVRRGEVSRALWHRAGRRGRSGLQRRSWRAQYRWVQHTWAVRRRRLLSCCWSLSNASRLSLSSCFSTRFDSTRFNERTH